MTEKFAISLPEPKHRKPGHTIIKHDIKDKQYDMQLLTAYHAGDLLALQVLLERHKGLVYYIVNQCMERGDNPEDFRDDLIQSGHIGMINGLKKADIHQPDGFIQFLSIKTRSSVLNCLEGLRNMRERRKSDEPGESKYVHIPLTSIDAPINPDSPENGNIGILIADLHAEKPFHDIDKTFGSHIIHSILDKLPKDEKNIITLRFGFGEAEESICIMSVDDIAKKLGKTRNYVTVHLDIAQNLIIRALAQLTQHPYHEKAVKKMVERRRKILGRDN